MKKLFFSTFFLFVTTFFISAQCGVGGEFRTVSTASSNTCEATFNFLGLVAHTGSKTTTTFYQNVVTGERCETVTSNGCGANGGSFDWWWE